MSYLFDSSTKYSKDDFFSGQILSGTMPKIKNRKPLIHTFDKDDVFKDNLIGKIYSLNFTAPIFIIYILKKLKGIICVNNLSCFFSVEKKKRGIIRLRALQTKTEKAVNHFTFFSDEKVT